MAKVVSGIDVRKADNGYILNYHLGDKDDASLGYQHVSEVYTSLNKLMKRMRELLS